MGQPRVLILKHSFICHLWDFIVKNAPDYHLNLNLSDSVTVQWHGVVGQTIAKVRQLDLNEVIRCRPDIVFLQIRTNDLTQRRMSSLTLGSAIEDFVRFLHDEYGVCLICVGKTLRRHLLEILMTMFNCFPSILRLCWSHYPLLFIGHIGVSGALPVLICLTMVYITIGWGSINCLKALGGSHAMLKSFNDMKISELKPVLFT